MTNEQLLDKADAIVDKIFGGSGSKKSDKPTTKDDTPKSGSSDGSFGASEGSPKTSETLRTTSLTTDPQSVLKQSMGVGGDTIEDAYNNLGARSSGIAASYDPASLFNSYGKDTVKNDPYGNLNDLSFEDTLASSRRADALNNMVRRDPVDIGYRTNSSYGSQGINFRDRQKNEGIETQEMRQMRMNEELAKQRQSQTVALLGDLDRYPLELKQQIDATRLDVAKLIGTNEINLVNTFREAVRDLAYVKTGQMSLDMAFQKYLLNLSYHTKSRVGQYIYQLWKKDPELSRIVGNMMGSGADVSAINAAIGNSAVWKDFISRLNAGEGQEAYNFLMAGTGGFAAIQAQVLANMIGMGFTGGMLK